MRNIKFRVWDNKLKKFLDPDDYCITGNGEIISWDWHWDSNNGKSWGSASESSLVIQQYTGIKDMNGVEIYEGDIIEYFDWVYANTIDSTQPEEQGKTFLWDFEDNNHKWLTLTCHRMKGVVSWDNKLYTWTPLIRRIGDDFYTIPGTGYTCFANAIDEENSSRSELKQINSKGRPNHPPSYYKVIGNIFEQST